MALVGSKIRYLLGIVQLSEKKFASGLKLEEGCDPRQTIKWYQGVAAPWDVNRTKLLKFLSRRLMITVDEQLFSVDCSLEDFKLSIDAVLRTRQRSICLDLPSSLRVFDRETVRDLCGTYYVVRYSLHGDMKQPRLVRDLLLITHPIDDAPYVNLEMHVFPSVGGNKVIEEGVEEATRDESFSGHLYWYGRCFYGVVTHSDGARDNRIRTLMFPLLDQRSFTHWGIISGYSLRLSEPASEKAIVDKISHDVIPWSPHDLPKVRRYSNAKHADVASYAPLVDNHIHENSSVLSVNKEWPAFKSLQEATIRELSLPEERPQKNKD